MPVHDLQFATFSGSNFIDLMPYQYGREICEPGHAFGPAQRRHYLFHYIISGRGTLLATDDDGEQRRFDLNAGEGFLIFPGQVNTYFADMEDPWEYVWVEFDGAVVKEAIRSTGLTTSSPIYRSDNPDLRDGMEREMRHLVTHREDSAFHLVAHTFLFLDYLKRSIVPKQLPTTNKLQDFYIREAINYIEQNYQNDISVEDIAEQTGLNRSYFGKVFKAVVNKSPQQYLIAYRMGKATELLKLTALSIGEVGKAVGYPNQLHFSRAFKTVYGVSPREWRKENTRPNTPAR
ncbi:AraC family transcriptional regulator [Collinsella sp. An2]|uniref:AraC family transcriptional regulator n=1 Tax=Collinsella sp. An2 TaxID=1965585 RepID=UPI000B3A1489|nr:AraC family transcriptional regulator [Collinsella sp. An2]OUP10474.1 AraC family transcriptional regulator [Collinsella sp. An2]